MCWTHDVASWTIMLPFSSAVGAQSWEWQHSWCVCIYFPRNIWKPTGISSENSASELRNSNFLVQMECTINSEYTPKSLSYSLLVLVTSLPTSDTQPSDTRARKSTFSKLRFTAASTCWGDETEPTRPTSYTWAANEADFSWATLFPGLGQSAS